MADVDHMKVVVILVASKHENLADNLQYGIIPHDGCEGMVRAYKEVVRTEAIHREYPCRADMFASNLHSCGRTKVHHNRNTPVEHKTPHNQRSSQLRTDQNNLDQSDPSYKR